MPKIAKEGTYNASVKDAIVEQSQNGSWRVALGFETDDGEGIYGYLYLTDKTAERSVETLEKVFDFNLNFETIADQLVGKRCSITCKEEEYQSKATMRVQLINPERTMAEGNSLRDLTAMACKLRGKPLPPEAPKTVEPASEEDPF